MAAGELNRPDGSFQRQPYPDFIEEYAGTRAQTDDKTALIHLLRET